MTNPLKSLGDLLYKQQPTPQPADAGFNMKLLLIGGGVGVVLLAAVPIYLYASWKAEARSPEEVAAIGKAAWVMLAVGPGLFLVKMAPWALTVLKQWRRRQD